MQMKTDYGYFFKDEKVNIIWDTITGRLIIDLEDGQKFVADEFWHQTAEDVKKAGRK